MLTGGGARGAKGDGGRVAVMLAGSAGAAGAPVAPGRRRARRSDSVRNAALVTQAAIELFAEHGLKVTLTQVAERAGVGKATVYRTYASRDDMTTAVLEGRLAWLRQRIEAAVQGQDAWQECAAVAHDVLQPMRKDHLLRYALAPAAPRTEPGAARRLWYLSARSRDITYYADRQKIDTEIQ